MFKDCFCREHILTGLILKFKICNRNRPSIPLFHEIYLMKGNHSLSTCICYDASQKYNEKWSLLLWHVIFKQRDMVALQWQNCNWINRVTRSFVLCFTIETIIKRGKKWKWLYQKILSPCYIWEHMFWYQKVVNLL